MITITRRFHFEAAHLLPEHEGKCKCLHGHSYKVEITVGGPLKTEGPEGGMVMDFGKLKKVVQSEVLSKLDHTLLNDTVPKDFHPPTAENLCYHIAGILLKSGIPLRRVRIYETEDSHADWERG